MPDKIEITKKEYYELLERDRFLCALEAAGVDNWVGYGDVQDIIEEWDKESEEE
jgi:hypothetical protein